MVNLSFLAEDPTLAALRVAVEKRINAEEPRNYIGASFIGHQCDRFIYYSYHNAPHAPIDWKGAFAIQNGHADEIVLANRLRMVEGIVLETEDLNGKQFGFSKFNGKYKGHYDGKITGLIQAPKTKHIWEAKSCNEKKFNNLKKCIEEKEEKDSLEAWDKIFYAQAVVYMEEEKVERHYLTACMPGVRDIISVRTHRNSNYAKFLEAKAERIIETKSAPQRIGENRDFFVCKFCKFSDFCWSDQ